MRRGHSERSHRSRDERGVPVSGEPSDLLPVIEPQGADGRIVTVRGVVQIYAISPRAGPPELGAQTVQRVRRQHARKQNGDRALLQGTGDRHEEPRRRCVRCGVGPRRDNEYGEQHRCPEPVRAKSAMRTRRQRKVSFEGAGIVDTVGSYVPLLSPGDGSASPCGGSTATSDADDVLSI